MGDQLHSFLNKEFQVDERIRAFRNRKFYNVEIELTDGCSLSCNYCYVNSKQASVHQLEFKTAKKLIDSLMNYGIKSFWWGGGEPLLNSRWREIMAYAKEKGATENLVFTNGLSLTRENCQYLFKLADRITVHLDTVRQTTWARLQNDKTANKQLHGRILAGIENLLETGFSSEMIRWNITLTRTILPDLEDTINFAICDKKVRTVVLIPLFSCGRGESVYTDQKLSLKELEYAFTLRSKIEKRPFLLKLGPSEFCKQYQLTCFTINASGDVLPYVDCFLPVGNIYSEDVCHIIDRNFDFLSFKKLVSSDTYKNRLNGKCKGCTDEKYCFGNPTMTLNDGGQLCDSDPNCWHVALPAGCFGG